MNMKSLVTSILFYVSCVVGKNVLLIKGKCGVNPADICRVNGYEGIVANAGNVPLLLEMLKNNKIESAGVAGWNDHMGNYVLRNNGSLAPFEALTNNSEYAFCLGVCPCPERPIPIYNKPQPQYHPQQFTPPRPQPCHPPMPCPIPRPHPYPPMPIPQPCPPPRPHPCPPMPCPPPRPHPCHPVSCPPPRPHPCHPVSCPPPRPHPCHPVSCPPTKPHPCPPRSCPPSKPHPCPPASCSPPRPNSCPPMPCYPKHHKKHHRKNKCSSSSSCSSSSDSESCYRKKKSFCPILAKKSCKVRKCPPKRHCKGDLTCLEVDRRFCSKTFIFNPCQLYCHDKIKVREVIDNDKKICKDILLHPLLFGKPHEGKLKYPAFLRFPRFLMMLVRAICERCKVHRPCLYIDRCNRLYVLIHKKLYRIKFMKGVHYFKPETAKCFKVERISRRKACKLIQSGLSGIVFDPNAPPSCA